MIHAPWLGLMVVAAAAVFAPTIGHADQALSIRVTPELCREPCSIWLAVGLEPHEDDREILIEVDSGVFYRSSMIELAGENEPAVHQVGWKSLPAGNYMIRVTLRRAGGHRAIVKEEVRVLAM